MKGTKLVRVLASDTGELKSTELVCPPSPELPDWLPNIERWRWDTPQKQSAIICTRGCSFDAIRSALGSDRIGNYNGCINDQVTEVWLHLGGLGHPVPTIPN